MENVMSHGTRWIRLLGGIILLVGLASLGLPFVTRTSNLHGDEIIRNYQLVLRVASEGYTIRQKLLIVIGVILPAIFGLCVGMVGILAKERQWAFNVGSIVVCILYIILLFNRRVLYPVSENDQIQMYAGYSLYVAIGCSVIAFILGLIDWFGTPHKQLFIPQGEIPDVMEIHKQQKDAMVSYTDEAAEKTSEAARGVMVGLTGCYAQAEIPLHKGEKIKLGRELKNDLVFANQSVVSREHCIIQWFPDKQKYMIVDHSSNGCFINGEMFRSIPRNKPVYLDVGTILDIGDANNRFRLE